MISAYKGEFLVSPIPLEIDLNYCSHKCNYCFANLNNPKRKANTNKIINQIKNCHNSKSIESYLLANGYPVLMSNKSELKQMIPKGHPSRSKLIKAGSKG